MEQKQYIFKGSVEFEKKIKILSARMGIKIKDFFSEAVKQEIERREKQYGIAE